MQLQRFVVSVIEAMGGVVEPLEYALVQVMVPPERAHLFQGREETLLAFDYEVAEENPQAEFVTFGSYLLDQLLAFVHTEALATVRIADIEPPALARAEEKIRKFFGGDAAGVTVKREQIIYGMWAMQGFRLNYISDEQETEFTRIWIDLTRGAICEEMGEQSRTVPLTEGGDLKYPLADVIGIDEAFVLAHGEAARQVELGKSGRVNVQQLEKERLRIADYYDELHKETVKRSERKGLSEQKKQELLDKAESIMQEKDKQLLDIADKYGIRTECLLDHGQLLLVPLLEYTVELVKRRESQEEVLYYNPLFRSFAMRRKLSGASSGELEMAKAQG